MKAPPPHTRFQQSIYACVPSTKTWGCRGQLQSRRRLSAGEDLCGRNQLARMARRVLGGMEQQTKHIRRQLGTSDAAILEKLFGSHEAQLIQRTVDLRGGVTHEIRQARGWLARFRLGAERGLCASLNASPCA